MHSAYPVNTENVINILFEHKPTKDKNTYNRIRLMMSNFMFNDSDNKMIFNSSGRIFADSRINSQR